MRLPLCLTSYCLWCNKAQSRVLKMIHISSKLLLIHSLCCFKDDTTDFLKSFFLLDVLDSEFRLVYWGEIDMLVFENPRSQEPNHSLRCQSGIFWIFPELTKVDFRTYQNVINTNLTTRRPLSSGIFFRPELFYNYISFRLKNKPMHYKNANKFEEKTTLIHRTPF